MGATKERAKRNHEFIVPLRRCLLRMNLPFQITTSAPQGQQTATQTLSPGDPGKRRPPPGEPPRKIIRPIHSPPASRPDPPPIEQSEAATSTTQEVRWITISRGGVHALYSVRSVSRLKGQIDVILQASSHSSLRDESV